MSLENNFSKLAREEMDSLQFKQARNDLKLSVTQLAEILNTSERTIRRWEDPSNERPPNPIAIRVMTMMLDGMNPLKYIDVLE